jgi:hypothetical protein
LASSGTSVVSVGISPLWSTLANRNWLLLAENIGNQREFLLPEYIFSIQHRWASLLENIFSHYRSIIKCSFWRSWIRIHSEERIRINPSL